MALSESQRNGASHSAFSSQPATQLAASDQPAGPAVAGAAAGMQPSVGSRQAGAKQAAAPTAVRHQLPRQQQPQPQPRPQVQPGPGACVARQALAADGTALPAADTAVTLTPGQPAPLAGRVGSTAAAAGSEVRMEEPAFAWSLMHVRTANIGLWST